MDFTSAWNKIVSLYNKNFNAKEEIIQSSWEQLFSVIFNYEDEEIDSQRNVQMGVNTKRADIVITNKTEDLFAVELKRYTLHEGREQLFSYLNQLKIDLGILVCDNLYIYNYDYASKENSYTYLEIPFTKDNSNGCRFIELFYKDNFNKQDIKSYIKECNSEKQISNEIKTELSEILIIKLLNQYFSDKYPDIEIDKILNEYKISLSKKTDATTLISPIIPNRTINSSYSGQKDSTKYSVNGIASGGKCPTVFTAVKIYLDSNPNISFTELQLAFPDKMAKPGFGKMLRRKEEISEKEWSGNRFNKHLFTLFDGTEFAVTTQWKPDNMNNFITEVKNIGLEIKPIE